jgi:uncharacterized membrane protein
MGESNHRGETPTFNAAEIGALAHLYRGELYRSTVWRTRLDTTTNWAVVSTGLALSLTFSNQAASPLPLVLVGLLVALYLSIEARRYRFFDFWRVRAHILETQFFGPILLGRGVQVDNGWNEILYRDYRKPRLHITYADALGRRLRKNYGWIFAIQVTSYIGKLAIHPEPIASVQELLARAAIGPVPGSFVLLAGLLFHAGWVAVALLTMKSGRGKGLPRTHPEEDHVIALAREAA